MVRGRDLDGALEELLAFMLASGEDITRPALQKKLGLSSRSTLSGRRAELIEKYREKQLEQRGISDAKTHRLSLMERSKRLAEENEKLQETIDHLTEQLQKIIANAEKYGLSPEQICEPLAPKRR